MEIGVTFPQTEIGSDPAVIRDYAQTAESLGFQHLLAYDHVIGADTSTRPDWGGRYTIEAAFHEPFVLFAYLGALTTTLEFVTGILILPQRQTVLVAKKAASLDVLTGGRLRLGIGIGWNDVEFESLNEDFHNRGRRVEEQFQVLRRLWTEPVVDFEGKWHHIDRAGINPMPVQQPIPLIMGGLNEKVLERAARIADGWFPILFRPEDIAAFPERVAKLKETVRKAGRNPDEFEIRVQTNYHNKTPDDWAKDIETFRNAGVDYLCVNTMGGGLAGREHIDAITKYMQSVGQVAR